MTPVREDAGEASFEADRVLAWLVDPEPGPRGPLDPDRATDADWRRLAELTRRTRMEAVVAGRVPEAPAELQRRWEQCRRETQAGNLLRLKAWQEISEAMGRSGVAPIPLKGIDLLLEGLAEPDRRPMTDLDMLVEGSHRTGARQVLEELGFRHYTSQPDQEVYLRPPLTVEVHHLLYPPPRPFPEPEPGIWERSEKGPGPWRRLGPEDRIAFLCLHYYLQEVRRARSWGELRDLALSFARGPTIEGDRLAALCRSRGWADFVARRLRELEDLLGPGKPAGLPPALGSGLEAATGRRRLWGFRLCEAEARRGALTEVAPGEEPGLRFYNLFWARPRDLPGLLWGSLSPSGGGFAGRLRRLGKRFLARGERVC